MKLIACYGSLKKGYYNHRAVGEDAEFLGRGVVRGVMYSNGSYPKLYRELPVPSKLTNENKWFNPVDSRDHVIEIYKINEDAFRNINAMELGAGYEAAEIETDWGTATIWYMPHEHFYEADKWVAEY